MARTLVGGIERDHRCGRPADRTFARENCHRAGLPIHNLDPQALSATPDP
jgi:hypothetical protein